MSDSAKEKVYSDEALIEFIFLDNDKDKILIFFDFFNSCEIWVVPVEGVAINLIYFIFV